MKTENVKLEFSNDFIGTVSSSRGEIKIGKQENGMSPYNLLYGALGSCFYHTFLTMLEKRRQTIESATIEISGEKRDADIATLEWVIIKLIVRKPSDEKQVRKCAELGTKFCSIHETISKVAKMELIVEFEA